MPEHFTEENILYEHGSYSFLQDNGDAIRMHQRNVARTQTDKQTQHTQTHTCTHTHTNRHKHTNTAEDTQTRTHTHTHAHALKTLAFKSYLVSMVGYWYVDVLHSTLHHPP